MKPSNLFLAAAFVALPLASSAGEPLASFDVAEDLSRFVFSPAPVFDDGMPAYGNAFVTQGYIYPAGTLDGGVELVEPGVAATRAVTGGTGDHADAPAEMSQVLRGMTDGYGVRLRVELGCGQSETYPQENDHTEWDSGAPVGPVTEPGRNPRG